MVGEWLDTRDKDAEHSRVFRGRSGTNVVHVERSAEWWAVDAEGKPAIRVRGLRRSFGTRHESVPPSGRGAGRVRHQQPQRVRQPIRIQPG